MAEEVRDLAEASFKIANPVHEGSTFTTYAPFKGPSPLGVRVFTYEWGAHRLHQSVFLNLN